MKEDGGGDNECKMRILVHVLGQVRYCEIKISTNLVMLLKNHLKKTMCIFNMKSICNH